MQRISKPILGGHDILLSASPGVDKRSSLVIPILQRLDSSLHQCQAVILTSSHKDAVSNIDGFTGIGKFMKIKTHFTSCSNSATDEEIAFESGVQVVIGSVARVYDMIERTLLCLDHVKVIFCGQRAFEDNSFKFSSHVFSRLPIASQIIVRCTWFVKAPTSSFLARLGRSPVQITVGTDEF